MLLVDNEKTNLKNFTYAYYKHMLSNAIQSGYCISSFSNYSNVHAKTIILRHDIDYSLNGIRELSKIEHLLGVTATYLFRLHANEYNLLSPYVYKLIRDLQDMGHEIGLHAEPMSYARSLNLSDAGDVLRKEKKIFEIILGSRIKTFSEHRDLSHAIHQTPYFHDCYNVDDYGFENFSMSDAFFKGMKYLSDSNGVWRDGDLIANLGKADRFQILVHPEWWSEEDLHLKGPYFHGLGN